MKLAFGAEICRNRRSAKLNVCHQTAPAKKAREVLLQKMEWWEGKSKQTKLVGRKRAGCNSHLNLNLFYTLSASSLRCITNLVGSFATLLILEHKLVSSCFVSWAAETIRLPSFMWKRNLKKSAGYPQPPVLIMCACFMEFFFNLLFHFINNVIEYVYLLS